MHYFEYKKNNLYCETTGVEDIARKIATPFYLYSYKTLTDHFSKLESAFKDIKPLICFSMKSNSNLSIVKSLLNEGSGLDIVSGGELYKAKLLRANPKKIVYASVGKTETEIKEAIQYGILLFNVESKPELALIDKISGQLRKTVDVCLRINPGVSASTHHYVRTAEEESKFGVDLDTAEDMFLRRQEFLHTNICGVHIHIGSQITQAKPFIHALNIVKEFIRRLRNDYNIQLKWLNIGGGLGIVYGSEKPQTAQEFANNVLPILKEINLRVILEPGRFIIGNAGILVTKVIYLKDTPKKRFIVVDAAMNDLIRPALYTSYHEILPVKLQISFFELSTKKSDIVGPICESADFLGKDRNLSNVKEGDLLAIMGTGAYGFSMSSNYNSRPRAAEAMVKNDKLFIIRKRETYADLVRKERIK